MHHKSSVTSLLFTGNIKHLLNPWHISVDFERKTITSKKRNWFLIGFDEKIVPFRYIRRIEVDTHLFGADMLIKVYGSGNLTVKCIGKNAADSIKEALINYNNKTPIKGMLI